MKVKVDKLGKRYGFQFVVRNINLDIYCGSMLGLSGRNGAGKSTMMQMIAGFLSPSEGTIAYTIDTEEILRESVYKYISYTAPYIELPQRVTIEELLNHYKIFKNVSIEKYEDFLQFCEIEDQNEKFIENFSSGMKQKIALGINLITDAHLSLFDEPTSYLDSHAKDWFYTKLKQIKGQKTIVIASNDQDDFKICDSIYEI